MNTVEGKHTNHKVKLYTLSTCGWCRKTKMLLNELNVTYQYVDVDMLSMDEKIKVKEELRHYNPRVSYPTVVIDEQPIIGFDREKIMEFLELRG